MAVATLTLAGCATPSETDNDAQESCRPSTAINTQIETIQADIDAWIGRCVRVRGMLLGRVLYNRREAILDPVSMFREDAPTSVVILSHRDLSLPETAAWVEIVGRVGSCVIAYEQARVEMADNPDFIVWVAGYCHTSLANFVRATDISLLPVDRPVRLTEAETPMDRRQLVTVDAALLPVGHLDAAHALVEALIDQDEKTFFQLVYPGRALHMDDRSMEDLDDLYDHRRTLNDPRLLQIFQPLHPLAERQRRIFVTRDQANYAVTHGDDHLSSFLICWCRTADCRGRWPVTVLDADNDPSRPYACISTYDYLIGPGEGMTFGASVDIHTDSMAEPDWPTSTIQP